MSSDSLKHLTTNSLDLKTQKCLVWVTVPSPAGGIDMELEIKVDGKGVIIDVFTLGDEDGLDFAAVSLWSEIKEAHDTRETRLKVKKEAS